MRENNELRDAVITSMDMARSFGRDDLGLVGFGVVELRDGDGLLTDVRPFANLVTDAGDLYCAQKLIQGISPAAPAAPTAANGMKLGNVSSSSPSKSGTGAALQGYLTGTNIVFDATYPTYTNLGAGLGVVAVYKTTWTTGSTITAIVEATICNDQATNAAGSASTTYARTTFASITKATTDSLSITWQWKQLGA